MHQYIQHKSAILFFSLSSKEERERKILLGREGKYATERIFKKFIKDTQTLCEQTGIDFIRVSKSHQVGANFGERLANSLKELFDKGYQNIVTIGNDCPGLDEETITTAFKALNSKDLVLGPSLDGGNYLIGINHIAFDKHAIQNLPWQSSALHSSLLEFARRNEYKSKSLDYLQDIDSENDLKNYISDDKNSELSLFIKLIQPKPKTSENNLTFGTISEVVLNANTLRGPPLVCLNIYR